MIRPVSTEFGYNLEMNNKSIGMAFAKKGWEPGKLCFHYTFFMHGPRFYCIGFYDDGEINLGASDFVFCDKSGNVDLLCFDYTARNSYLNPIGIFNRAFFILLEMLERIRINQLYFHSSTTPNASKKLDKIYSRMLESNKFQDTVNQRRFLYIGKAGNNYCFSRIGV